MTTVKALSSNALFKLVDLPRPSFMDKTPKELAIGTWGNILTISMHTPLIDALRTFLQKRVSALPLVDKDGKVHLVFFFIMRRGGVPGNEGVFCSDIFLKQSLS